MPAKAGIHGFREKKRVFFFVNKKEAKKTLIFSMCHRKVAHPREAEQKFFCCFFFKKSSSFFLPSYAATLSQSGVRISSTPSTARRTCIRPFSASVNIAGVINVNAHRPLPIPAAARSSR